MDSVLLTILTSTVISALVTVLAEYLNLRRANMLIKSVEHLLSDICRRALQAEL